MRILLSGIILVLAIGLILLGVQIYKIRLAASHPLYFTQAFAHTNPQAKLKFLFVGDSTAMGTGAQSNAQSVAGWFGQDFPEAHIDSNAANGRRIAELEGKFPPYPGQIYDLIVIQIGANDILRFTDLKNVEQSLSHIIEKAKSIGQHVVILHSGNVGLAPIFIWPFDAIMTHRARQMRALYMKKAKEEHVLYVDLFTERNDDLFLKDIDKYYSADHLHPSGEGYHWWYQKIRWTLDQAGVVM
jgi:lysophospholipase L1-like esterase